MASLSANFPVRWWMGAMSALALCAEGQSNAPAEAPVIIFSQPLTEASNQPSLFSRHSLSPANELTTPGTDFKYGSPGPTAAVAPPMPMNASAAQRLQKLLDEKANWALMTPEEILGVATPKSIIEGADSGADANGQHLSVMERYLARQEALRLAAYSNAVASEGLGGRWGSSTTNDSRATPTEVNLQEAESIAARFSEALVASNRFGMQPGALTIGLAGFLPDQTWLNKPNQPGWGRKAPNAPLPRPSKSKGQVNDLQSSPMTGEAQYTDGNPLRSLDQPFSSLGALGRAAQPADEQAFGEFLPATMVSETPGSTPPDLEMYSVLRPPPNEKPISQAPLLSPGASPFAPMDSGIGQPLGLPPLPTVSGYTNRAALAQPAWTPQQPPWLSPLPAPGMVPQRRF